jgi:hypothetical protein
MPRWRVSGEVFTTTITSESISSPLQIATPVLDAKLIVVCTAVMEAVRVVLCGTDATVLGHSVEAGALWICEANWVMAGPLNVAVTVGSPAPAVIETLWQRARVAVRIASKIAFFTFFPPSSLR